MRWIWTIVLSFLVPFFFLRSDYSLTVSVGNSSWVSINFDYSLPLWVLITPSDPDYSLIRWEEQLGLSASQAIVFLFLRFVTLFLVFLPPRLGLTGWVSSIYSFDSTDYSLCFVLRFMIPTIVLFSTMPWLGEVFLVISIDYSLFLQYTFLRFPYLFKHWCLIWGLDQISKGSIFRSYILWWWSLLECAGLPHPFLVLVVLVSPLLSSTSPSRLPCLTIVLSSCFCARSCDYQHAELSLHLQGHHSLTIVFSWYPLCTGSFLIPGFLILLFTYPICFGNHQKRL